MIYTPQKKYTTANDAVSLGAPENKMLATDQLQNILRTVAVEIAAISKKTVKQMKSLQLHVPCTIGILSKNCCIFHLDTILFVSQA